MVYFGVNREHRSQVSVVGGQLEYDAPQCIIMQMRGKRRSRTEPSEHFNEMKTNSFVLYAGKTGKGKDRTENPEFFCSLLYRKPKGFCRTV